MKKPITKKLESFSVQLFSFLFTKCKSLICVLLLITKCKDSLHSRVEQPLLAAVHIRYKMKLHTKFTLIHFSDPSCVCVVEDRISCYIHYSESCVYFLA